jgi:DNA polymerase elongation subunit (family B)
MVENVSPEIIKDFLEGSDPQKYIVGIEADYYDANVYLIINNPETGKKSIETHRLRPFVWMKQEGANRLFNGDRGKIRVAMDRHNIKITKLKIDGPDGKIPSRMETGFKYLVQGGKSYGDLLKFFKEAGVDVYGEEKHFIALAPAEQFLIQTNKRLFKGIEFYDDLHRFQFDLETTGLDPKIHSIFQIGMKDNRGFEQVIEVVADTEEDRRNVEIAAISTFFEFIDYLKPDIIAGYNSEFFDFDFIVKRCEVLGYDIENIAKTLKIDQKFKRTKGTVKFGSETEFYEKTTMWGHNIIDISHAVRRAQAINSDIKAWGLKYITKFTEIAKPDRVYVEGDKIHTTWADQDNKYCFNKTNGDWSKFIDSEELKDGYEIVSGKFIVERYLIDDLWETEQIDVRYNQASFLLSKMIPTSFTKTSTMGNASIWKLLMCAWSYGQGLGIPNYESKRDFTGGLSRLLEVGYSKKVVKLDYAALYPNIELSWNIFPDLDISGVMKGLLQYIVDTRDRYKFEKNKYSADSKRLAIEGNYEESEKLAKLSNDLGKKEQPIKILANSFFGAYGAPYIFPWGDTNSAEETTCRGRQYLRLMVSHFTEKYNFRALVGDSVTHDTPIYLKDRLGELDIKPICDLFNENSEYIDMDGLRDYENKDYQILTRNGWTNIHYVYRHGTEKKIHKITTKDRLVNVTEDHSLFRNGEQIKPSLLVRGDEIDIYNINEFSSNKDVITEDTAWLYGFFLGDGSSTNSRRNKNYTSKKTGLIKTYKIKRSDWKISNTNLEFLNKLKEILMKDFGLLGIIKDHMKSSGVYNLVVHKAGFSNYFSENFYTSYREKKIPSIILNSNENIKRMFIEGVFASDGYGNTIDTCSSIGMKSQTAMAGISYLLDSLNIEYKIVTRKDKQNFISFNLKNPINKNSSFSGFTKKTLKKDNLVWKNEIIINNDKNKFVYDISTEDGTFIGGIGGVVLKNTDGMNFNVPENINDFKYISNGKHRFNEAGVEYIGTEAAVAEFNDNFMENRMGLDIDDEYVATINFSRKNYANHTGKKIKLVGNTVKSKKMPTYIEEFMDNGIKMLLNGNGTEFLDYYYSHVQKIYNCDIPLAKIASKARVKISVADYKKKMKSKNKAGGAMAKQAHMELAIKHDLSIGLGDVIYYVNTGDSKSKGDIQTVKNKETGKLEKLINCKLIPVEEIENNPDLTTDEYNIPKYLAAFNKRIKPLLVCFSKEIRNKIIIDMVKDKTTKELLLEPRTLDYDNKHGILTSGEPMKESDQDTYQDLMTMEDKEFKFWINVNKTPNCMSDDGWTVLRDDYIVRMEAKRVINIANEKATLEELFKKLEISDIVNFGNAIIPSDISTLAIMSLSDGFFYSNLYDVKLLPLEDIYKYESDAKERDEFYKTLPIDLDFSKVSKYELWFNDKIKKQTYSGDTISDDMKLILGEISTIIDDESDDESDED